MSGPKYVFRLTWATCCPDKREIWHGIRTVIPLLVKFIPKIPSLAILGALGPHFNRDNGETWGEGIRTWDTLLCA